MFGDLMESWRLVADPPYSGIENMARDEAILRTVARGDQPPTLRVYRWDPPCLSLGYGQPLSIVDQQRLQDRGWGLVRRPTGGQAILHADELTYSISLPKHHPLGRKNVIDTYDRINHVFKDMMYQLGLDVDYASSETISSKSMICFESPSRHELTVQGKKLIGSAQMRRHGGILQHGSIPIHGDVSAICDVLVCDDEFTRDHMRQHSINLAEAGALEIIVEDVAALMQASFERILNIQFTPMTLSDAESELSQTLIETVYRTAAWNGKR